MRRLLPWLGLLIILPLTACSLLTQPGGEPPAGSTPTMSSEQMQTQIAQMLTLMPTNTTAPADPSAPTDQLPTVAVDTPEPEESGEVIPTETAAPTNTPEPEQPVTPTETPLPEPTATPTEYVLPTFTVAPQPSFTPSAGDPRSRLGAPTATDPMDNSSTWFWPTGSDKYTSASFSDGFMSLSALTDTDGWRMANPRDRAFSNIYLEGSFRTTTCSGSDHYGMILRVPEVHEPDQGYLFGVTCDGRYSLRKWDGEAGTNGEMRWLVNWTASSAIASGSNASNRLGIFAVGSRLVLYANGTLLTEVNDASFPEGYFGVFAGSDETPDLTIRVDEMSFWENVQP
ncbi:MAG: hypothetical protein GX491_13480 [Chloroflexi bacterium]|nr:hypothetical protein [Chloroflexota bacterium]